MGLRTMHSIVALAGVTVLTAALSACGGGSGAAGKSLDVLIGANAQYPKEQQAWFTTVGEKFKAQTGATIKWETFASANDELEVEDVATGVVCFSSGALGVLHATTSACPGLSARLQVHGDRGSAVIDNDRLVFFETGAGKAVMGRTSPQAVPTAGSSPGQLSGAHRLQYLNFLAALDGTEKLRVDLETNRQPIAVITGAYESARTGRPVRLR
jgi:predicted dehydrogenase